MQYKNSSVIIWYFFHSLLRYGLDNPYIVWLEKDPLPEQDISEFGFFATRFLALSGDEKFWERIYKRSLLAFYGSGYGIEL